MTLRDCVIGESPGKAMFTSGTTDITIQRSLITHLITGPELQDGTSLLCEDTNIQEILPTYRESNDQVPDDEDCLYIHNGSGRSVIVSRCVFAMCGDDVIDNLAGPINVQDSILRQGWDKGISLLNNDLTILAHADHRLRQGDCLEKQRRHDADRHRGSHHHLLRGTRFDSRALGLPNRTGRRGRSGRAGDGYLDAEQSRAEQSRRGAASTRSPTRSSRRKSRSRWTRRMRPGTRRLLYTCTHDTDTAARRHGPATATSKHSAFRRWDETRISICRRHSPCKNTGDPAFPLDTDGSRTDMGALPFGGSGGIGTPTNIQWSLANSPYHITTDVTIATGTMLTIEPGVTVLVDENKHILVNGKVNIVGTADRHITMRGVPGLPLKADPADAGLPLTSPKWGGLWIENSNDPNNIISYVDFVDAQDMLSGSRGTSRGCIEAKNSQLVIDHCTFRGTHLHMIYGDFSSLTIQYCTFPDMFAAGEVPGTLDNVSEHVKMINKFPPGGHCILFRNTFGGNKGHNDVVDIDSGVLPNPILQARENIFHGQTGDEDLDLGGDAFLDGNVFSHGTKDQWNTPGGYASAFTTGDAGGGTTIVASRNIFWDMDHATAIKSGTGSIFEYNTAFDLHATYSDPQGRPQRASVITFVVPEEGTTPGDGAYLGNNIFWRLPVILGQPDVGTGGNGTFNTKLQADDNDLDPQIPQTVGANHPDGFFSLGVNNFYGDPLMIDPDNGDFRLAANSPARGVNVFGKDLGALVPGGVWITGEPMAQTPSTSATLTVGGPGIFYYKWKLDAGSWSAAIAIDPANPLHFPRTAPTKRTAQLALTNLANGSHTVSVIGQDFAGVWQEEADATVSKTWTVNTALQLVQINEVLADSATLPDTIELVNNGAGAVDVGGWTLSDDPLAPAKYVIPAGTTIPGGGFHTIPATTSGIALDRNGDAVYLHHGAALVDSVAFGNQIADLTIGRIGHEGEWTLCTPTLGAANTAVRLGDPSTVRINEWFTSGNARYTSDWVELANPSALPVDLAGLRISDNRVGNPQAHVFAPLTFIDADGFARFIADGMPAQGPSHLNFSFDAQQESIALLDANGAQFDIVLFYAQTTDYSQGRDANGNYVFYELPTRGFTNGTGDPGYANALALLHGLRVTEIMFNPVGGSEYEYVELRNVGPTPFEMQGVEISNGINFIFGQQVLNPGEEILVVKNLSLFRARYGSGPTVAGTFTGSLDNAGEKLELRLPPPFDANVLNFAYNNNWFASADGGGHSLVVANPLLAAGLWGDRDTWMASTGLGGNPGGAALRTDTFSGWSASMGVNDPLDDGDKDGVVGIIEFGLGMNPNDPNNLDGAAGVLSYLVNASGHGELQFQVPSNPAAVQVHGWEQVDYAVQARDLDGSWETIATKSLTTPWAGTGSITIGAPLGGKVPITVTDPGAVDAPRLMRLQVIFVP